MDVKTSLNDNLLVLTAPVKLGKVIRNKRESLELSQESLAALSDLNRNYIGEVERGEVSISVIALEKIAIGLGVKLSELITLYEQFTD